MDGGSLPACGGEPSTGGRDPSADVKGSHRGRRRALPPSGRGIGCVRYKIWSPRIEVK